MTTDDAHTLAVLLLKILEPGHGGYTALYWSGEAPRWRLTVDVSRTVTPREAEVLKVHMPSLLDN